MKWLKTLTDTIKNSPTKLKAAFAATLLSFSLAGFLVVSGVVFAGWTPDRPVYNWNNEADRIGSMNGPRMNAFINTPFYGDERTFFDACAGDYSTCRADAGGVFKDVLPNPTDSPSRKVVLRTYVHNGANQETNDGGLGIARNAKVRIDLPTGTERALRMRSYISISNPAPGYPGEVTDTTELVDGRRFSIRYVPGSAKIYTSALNGTSLSDSIVTSGAPIGFDAVNGNMPGCFEFQAIVTVEVEISFADHKLEKVVREAGTTNYGEQVTVNPGDTVQWRLFWQNIGSVNLDNVVITDQLPRHLRVVPNSVRWIYRATDGTDRDEVQPDNALFNNYVDFGDWGPNGGFYLRFDTVALNDFAGCEVTLDNLAHAHNQQNQEDITDFAKVKIVKENCAVTPPPPPPPPPPVRPPTVLPVTGAGNVVGIFSAITVAGTVAHRIWLGRRR